MGLAEHYRAWEEPEDALHHSGKIIEFSNKAWVDVLNILRELSVDLSCEITDLNTRGGTASGIIEVCDKWIYGEMRWIMRDPALHEYTLTYEIGVVPSYHNNHFELTEEILLPIDKSYVPSFVDHILHTFPQSSIMSRRICTFSNYDYAI